MATPHSASHEFPSPGQCSAQYKHRAFAGSLSQLCGIYSPHSHCKIHTLLDPKSGHGSLPLIMCDQHHTSGHPYDGCHTPHTQLPRAPWLNGQQASMPARHELPHGLDVNRLPRHVALIVDGNSRWAEAMGRKRSEGHKKGIQQLMKLIWLSSEWGLSAFTAFLFSTENWNRSQVEVATLMEIFENNFVDHIDNFSKYNIKVKVIGDTKQLPQSLQNTILLLEEKTSQNYGLKVSFAINYGGHLDTIQAFRRVAIKVQEGRIKAENVSMQDIENELSTSWMKDNQNPDLLIRTSGEQRISNFLLWQAAYSELLFLDTYFPAMNEIIYAKALMSYQERDRRYGRRDTPRVEA